MSVQLEKKSKQQSNKTSASMEITCALYQTEACPFPTTCDGKIGSAMLGKTIAANKPQKSSRNESFLFYAFFQNASYPLCASYKSNLLVTS